MANKIKWDGRMRGGIIANSILLFLARIFGVRISYFILKIITLYFFMISGKARRASYQYLRHRFKNIRGLKLFFSCLKHFYTFGQIIFDRFLFFAFPKRFKKRIIGEEYIREHARNKKGVILISAHLGNWNLASNIFSNYKIPFNLMMFDTESERIKNFLNKTEKSLVNIIRLNDPIKATLEAKDALERGEIVAILGDRIATGHSNSIDVEFFGEKAEFPLGPFNLAYITNSPIIFTYTVKEDKYSYLFYADPPIEIDNQKTKDRKAYLRELATLYVKHLEDCLEKYPYQWFNFYKFWN